MRLLPVDPEAPISLRDEDAVADELPRGKRLRRKLEDRLDTLAALQRRLHADGRFAALVVLEGRDASGKDSVIRRVFGACDPQGLTVTSFTAPAGIELRHDFLWRVHRAVPPRGILGVFNRSHYEDLIVPRVSGTLPREEWQARYDQINDFERMLVQNRCVVLKFFLHVSRPEQRRRLLKRIERPDRNWKFSMEDLEERRLRDAYTDAYRDMLRRCSTDEAPWYIVPADDKRERDYLVAGAVNRTLERLDLRYPDADPNVLLEAEQALSA